MSCVNTVWNCTDRGTPNDGEVVLIHVQSLGEHGYVTAWFDDLEGQWVALDDTVVYEADQARFWTRDYPRLHNYNN